MLQLRSDLRFFDEPRSPPGVRSCGRQHPLHRDLSARVAVDTDQNLPHATFADRALMNVLPGAGRRDISGAFRSRVLLRRQVRPIRLVRQRDLAIVLGSCNLRHAGGTHQLCRLADRRFFATFGAGDRHAWLRVCRPRPDASAVRTR